MGTLVAMVVGGVITLFVVGIVEAIRQRRL